MDELKNLWNTNQLEFHGTAEKYRNHYAFKELIDFCYDAEWIPYCKKTFNGAQSVIDYLGKYRSEERRVGKECLRLCRSRWSPYH